MSASICAIFKRLEGVQLAPIHFWNQSALITAQTADVSKVSQLNRVTYLYIAPAIIFFGLLGDVLTIATLTHPLLRRAGIIYTYLTLLAMTDLFTQLSVIPMILWLLDMRLCSSTAAFYYAHIGFPLANALMGASVWLVVFLTLSQYMAVCHPFRQGALRKRRTSCWLFAVACLLSGAIHVPWARKKYVTRLPDGILHCPYIICDRPTMEEWFRVYEWVREFLTRVLPFILITYFNAKILITYRRTKKDRMTRLASQSVHHNKQRAVVDRSEREETRLFTLLFAIIIVFFLCTIPAAPLTIFVADKHSQNLSFQIFRAVTNLLEFTKFALNFYFYCLINPDIRRVCSHIIRCDELNRPARVKGQPVNLLSVYSKSACRTPRTGYSIPGPYNDSSRRSSRQGANLLFRRVSILSQLTSGVRTRASSNATTISTAVIMRRDCRSAECSKKMGGAAEHQLLLPNNSLPTHAPSLNGGYNHGLIGHEYAADEGSCRGEFSTSEEFAEVTELIDLGRNDNLTLLGSKSKPPDSTIVASPLPIIAVTRTSEDETNVKDGHDIDIDDKPVFDILVETM